MIRQSFYEVKRLLLLSSIFLLLSACSKNAVYTFPTQNDLYYCRTADFEGYIKPLSSTNQNALGQLYIDRGELTAQPVDVEVRYNSKSKKEGALTIVGSGFNTEIEQLSVYQSPQQPKLSLKQVNYLDPLFTYQCTTDVPYSKAPGYWSSYPHNNNKPMDEIFMARSKRVILDDYKERQITFDVYTPNDDCLTNYPLVVMIHGGAFYDGDKGDEEYKLWCQRFAERGYLAVSLNYRLGWGPVDDAVERAVYRSVQDVRAAVCYLLSNNEQYRVDPTRIYLAGCSAGAIAALHTAFMPSSERPRASYKTTATNSDLGGLNATLMDDLSVQDFQVAAVCSMWGGIIDDPGCEVFKHAKTKILFIQSEKDHIVPAYHDYAFKEYADLVKTFDKASQLISAFLFSEAHLVPKIMGCYALDAYLTQHEKELGIEHELIKSNRETHTLIRDDAGKLNDSFTYYFNEMCQFFSKDMVRHPVRLGHRSNSQMVFNTDPADIRQGKWEINGGIIKSIASDGGGVEVLLFSDSPTHTLTYRGVYQSHIPFVKTIKL